MTRTVGLHIGINKLPGHHHNVNGRDGFHGKIAIHFDHLKEIITLTIVRKAELQAAGKAEQGRGDSPLCVVKCALTVLMVKRICFL